MASAKKQWVNLAKEARFVEDEIKSVKELGPRRYDVEFAKGEESKFKVTCEDKKGAKNAVYTAGEKKRNPHFKLRIVKTETNKGATQVKGVAEVHLPAAGGNQYIVKAKHKRQVKESGLVVETWRKLFYQPIHMVGITVPDLGPTEDAYKKHFIVLKNAAGAGQIAYVKNVNDDDATELDALTKAVKGAYTIDKYRPWAFAVAFVEMLGYYETTSFSYADSPDVPLPSKLTSFFDDTVTFTLPRGKYLWYGLNPTHDAMNGGKGGWLVPNSAEWDDGAGNTYSIPYADIEIDKTKVKSGKYGGYNTLKIKMPRQLRNTFSAKKGKIKIDLLTLKGFSGGFSLPDLNLIVVGDSGWFKQYDDVLRLYITNHEAGHKIGMVQDGSRRKLEPPPHLYGNIRGGPRANNNGHQGPHCGNGANYTAAGGWIGTPKCVMFGATACLTAPGGPAVASPPTYCDECEKLVPKLDLDGRMLPGLLNSVKTK